MNSRRTIILTCVLLLVMTAMVFAQDAEADGSAAAKKMTLWDLIVTGGWAMWPLGLCSFGLIAMVVVNFRQVNQKKLMPPDVVAQLKVAAKEGDIKQLWDVARATPSLFTNALVAGVRHINLDDPAASKLQMEDAISEAVGREEAQVGYWIHYLSLIAAISPMIGLLGTVSGMIGAFQKIAGGGMGKPELLAGNIGEALITTATGLTIAIPAMYFFFMFRNKLNQLLLQAEQEYSIIMDDLTGTGISQLESAVAEVEAEAVAEEVVEEEIESEEG